MVTKVWNRPVSFSAKEHGSSVVFIHFLDAIFNRIPLELLSPLCAFENSSKCINISFGSGSFLDSVHTMSVHFENGEKCDGYASRLHENCEFYF